jgi:hypothetical protein
VGDDCVTSDQVPMNSYRSAFVAVAFHATVAGAQARFDTVVMRAGAARHPNGATLVKEVTIGDDSGAPEFTFTKITDVLLAKDGSVWLVDIARPDTFSRGNKSYVRQYDARGRYVRLIGGMGQGPGEYAAPSGLAQLSDGRVVLRDTRLNRINVYRADGRPETVWPFTVPVSQVPGGGLYVDKSGLIWMAFGPYLGPASFLRLRPNGAIVDTIPSPVLERLPQPQMVLSGASTFIFTAPYYPSAAYAWSPSGQFVTVRGDRYQIDIRQAPPPARPASRPLLSIRRTVAPVPVTTQEHADQRAQLRALADWFGVEYQAKLTESIPDIPRVKPFFRGYQGEPQLPPVNGLHVGMDERVWVHVSMPSERFTPTTVAPEPGHRARPVLGWREPTAYDVFEANGTYVGRVTLPSNARPKVFRGDEVWCTVRDEDDVITLVKYRVVWR